MPQNRSNGHRRPPLARTQIHLPPLSADYALTLVGILERAVRAVWRAHGYEMAELMQLREDNAARDRARRRHPLRDDGREPDDPDLPF